MSSHKTSSQKASKVSIKRRITILDDEILKGSKISKLQERTSEATDRKCCGLCKRPNKKMLDVFRQELSTDDHMVPLQELAERYETDVERGLSMAHAAQLLVKYGKNQLNVAKGKPMWVVFLMFMFGGFAAILWIGGALSFASFMIKINTSEDATYDELYLGIVICVICICTGIFGFVQEMANHRLMIGFSKMVPKNANVIRGGQEINISAEDLVPGDLVKVTAGECIPADIRILECNALKVDNSSITGESDPQARSPHCTDNNPLETSNLAFFGSNVIEGRGVGLVVATGQNTLIGHIATLTSGLEPDLTPIKKEVNRFIKFITVYSFCVSSIFFIIGLAMGYTWYIMFLYFIGLLVANIPEALLVTITACLTLMAKVMTKKNCMVKNMHAIETLGQTNVICSDKTGTLTQNRMTVSHMYYDHTIHDVLSDTYKNGDSSNFLYLCRCGILCSRARFQKGLTDGHEKEIIGDASESAVLKCMQTITRNTSHTRKQYPKIFEIPFNSTNKFQVSIHARPYDSHLLLVMKGAPERILDRCSKIIIDETEYDLNEIQAKRLGHVLREVGYMGERILGFADLKLPVEFTREQIFIDQPPNFPLRGLRFLGFMSMIDPPRPGVPGAIAMCKRAGMRVVMVTGDHPITAMAIARKIGLISPENDTVYDIAMRRSISMTDITPLEAKTCQAAVINGNDLRHMTAPQLEEACRRYRELVFARTSPQQKLRIVEAFQRCDNVVAVTGDGVNDSPALKKADIGIAMGITGSEVSKEAADLVLLDDNFTSIVAGIEQGRLIYDNLKKSIAYMLTSNIPEVIPFLMFVFLKMPQITTVMAVLIMDVGTDLWPSISFAYEAPESDIMTLPPRNSKVDTLVTSKLILFCFFNIGTAQALAGLAVWFYTMAEYGFLPSRLIGIQSEWIASGNDVVDSYGFEWTYDDRLELERLGVSGYFLGIVVSQVADLIISKTRRLSIVQQGMNNNVMLKGMLFAGTVAIGVVYIPYLNTVLGFGPISPYCLWPALPFSLFIFLYDEMRKYMIRRNPDGWISTNTYY